MTPLVKKLLLPLTVCLPFLGCNTISDVTPTDGGDLDWSRGIADGVVADLYGEGLFMYKVEATYLDLSGFLYSGVQHPFWRLWYINNDPEIFIHVVVHPGGSTTVTEYYSYFYDEIEFNYTSFEVQNWLSLSSHCYRYITEREDDICYGLSARCREYSSSAWIFLYDGLFERLAGVVIDLIDGTISSFYLY